MSTENDLLPARLARMRALVARLEQVCSESADQRDACERLRSEIEAVRASLKPIKP